VNNNATLLQAVHTFILKALYNVHH